MESLSYYVFSSQWVQKHLLNSPFSSQHRLNSTSSHRVGSKSVPKLLQINNYSVKIFTQTNKLICGVIIVKEKEKKIRNRNRNNMYLAF